MFKKILIAALAVAMVLGTTGCVYEDEATNLK